jgi:hypothetical protein
MMVVDIRRIWAVAEILSWDSCPSNVLKHNFTEALILMLISALWLIFVYELRNLFKKYLNDEGVLLEREQVVESRETWCARWRF